MSNPFNGSKNGKRGRRAGAEVRKRTDDPDYEPKHKDTMSGRVANGSANKKGESYSPAFFECSATTESFADYLVPRRSLTAKQGLRVFPEYVQFEEMKPTRHWQLDKVSGQLVETTNPRARVAWKSDRTLLRKNKPLEFGEGRGTGFTRITSNSKKRVLEIEIKPADNTELAWSSEVEDPLAEIEAIAAAAAPVKPVSVDDLINSTDDFDSLIDISEE